MSDSSLSRLAGPLAVLAGSLMVGAQLVMLPFDPKAHIATSTSLVFQMGGVAYLLGFITLLLFAFASHGWHAARSGRFGVVATFAAAIGTMMLGGDLWFETFAVPWLADQAPNAFDTDPTILFALGALSSYVLFALGWVLYGIAGLRAKVFPSAISATIVITAVAAYRALLSPWAIPLGLAIGALGIWMIRTKTSRTDVAEESAPVSASVS